MTRSVVVDSFVVKNSNEKKIYVKIRSISKTVSQYIEKKFLSSVLDVETLNKVQTFKDENMEAGDSVVLEFGKVLILEMLSTRLLALDNKKKMETIERRLDVANFFKEDIPSANEEALRDLYGTGKRGIKRPRMTNRKGPRMTNRKGPKRAAKEGSKMKF